MYWDKQPIRFLPALWYLNSMAKPSSWMRWKVATMNYLSSLVIQRMKTKPILPVVICMPKFRMPMVK